MVFYCGALYYTTQSDFIELTLELTFESVDENPNCDHSYESFEEVLSFGDFFFFDIL